MFSICLHSPRLNHCNIISSYIFCSSPLMKTWTFNVTVAPCGLSIRPQASWPCGSLERCIWACVHVGPCVCVRVRVWQYTDGVWKINVMWTLDHFSSPSEGMARYSPRTHSKSVSCLSHTHTHTHTYCTDAYKHWGGHVVYIWSENSGYETLHSVPHPPSSDIDDINLQYVGHVCSSHTIWSRDFMMCLSRRA